MIRALVALWMILLAGGSTAAQKPYGGTATGNLVLDGKPVTLRFAYVVEVDNVEEAGLMLEGPQKYLVIVLSDRELPAASVSNRNAPFADRRSPAEIMEPLRKGEADRIQGILLKVDSKKPAPFDARLLYPSDAIAMSVAGLNYPDRVTAKIEGGSISGTAVLASAVETHASKGPKKYQYRVTFRAPLQAEAPVTDRWEGTAALDSPPVRAIREYLAAANQGSVASLQKLTASSHLPYLGKPEVIKYLQKADASKLVEQVKRVVVRGDTAAVIVVNEQPNYSQVTIQMVRDKGVWKLYWP